MKSFMKEFKEFAMQGNVMDMAVGVIIAGAFSGIIGSLVTDIFMPIIGVITGGIDFSALAINVGDAHITYGNFINAVINFLMIALCVFTMVRALNKIKKPEPEAEPEVDPTLAVLEEIRDSLKKK
ncbi:MAG: large-conductance mechanosensitive channel protein MscL [Erysipelotrichaceae bacterium]|nr:large-conductance mechanosensitive channel protein MscL [Erysipelotrichaceae bacterium]